ncbi:C-type lectin domain-containing protein, partial [bacterium]|nr:C-type lectin domain-containing protein [bacterium]
GGAHYGIGLQSMKVQFYTDVQDARFAFGVGRSTDFNEKIVLSTTGSGRIGVGVSTPSESLDVSGNIKSTGTITGTNFSGPGTGLTGTAAGLTVGTATNATTATTATTVADNAITTAKIDNLTILAEDIANNVITATQIATGGVGTLEILDGTVTGTDIALNTITAVDIAASAVDTSELALGAVTSEKIEDGTITNSDIATDTITATRIAANAVGTSEIADDTVTSTDIANNTITAADIAPNAVATSEILDNTVSSTDILNNTVLAIDIAIGGVATSEILDGTILATDIANNVITATQIAADAVGSSEIANDAVTMAKIADSSAATNQVIKYNGSDWEPANTLWTESGSNVYRSAGNVGIGTTSPQTALDVTGIVRASSEMVAGNFRIESANVGLYQASGTDMALRTNGATRLTITEVGRVGIGTTTPSEKLDVVGNIKSTGTITGTTITGTNFSGPGTGLTGTAAGLTVGNAASATNATTAATASSVLAVAGNVAAPSISFYGASDIGIYRRTNDSMSFSVKGEHAVEFKDGRVAIGFVNPSYKLHVGGNIVATGSVTGTTITASTQFTGPGTGLTGTAAGLTVGNATTATTATTASSVFAINGSDASPSITFASDADTGMYNQSPNTLKFATGGSERLRVDSNGNVGIGVVSPSEKVHVAGNIIATQMKVNSSSGYTFWDETGGDSGLVSLSNDTLGLNTAGVSRIVIGTDLVEMGGPGSHVNLELHGRYQRVCEIYYYNGIIGDNVHATSRWDNADTYANNHCYVLVETNRSVHTASETCKAAGGYLVTLTNQQEIDFVDIMDDKWTWIGLTDIINEAGSGSGSDHKFGWMNGELAPNSSDNQFSNWANNEPSSGSEDCVLSDAAGLWYDWDCSSSELHYYICEFDF